MLRLRWPELKQTPKRAAPDSRAGLLGHRNCNEVRLHDTAAELLRNRAARLDRVLVGAAKIVELGHNQLSLRETLTWLQIKESVVREVRFSL